MFNAEDEDSDVEYEDEDAFADDEEDSDMERYELRSNCVLEILSAGDIIALFSPSHSIEQFYLQG